MSSSGGFSDNTYDNDDDRICTLSTYLSWFDSIILFYTYRYTSKTKYQLNFLLQLHCILHVQVTVFNLQHLLMYRYFALIQSHRNLTLIVPYEMQHR